VQKRWRMSPRNGMYFKKPVFKDRFFH